MKPARGELSDQSSSDCCPENRLHGREPITSFRYRNVEVRRVVRNTSDRPDGDVEILWNWKATVNGAVLIGTSMEDVVRQVDAALALTRRN